MCKIHIREWQILFYGGITMCKRIVGLVLLVCLTIGMSAVVFASEPASDQESVVGTPVRVCPDGLIERLLAEENVAIPAGRAWDGDWRSISDYLDDGFISLLQRIENAILHGDPIYVVTFPPVMLDDEAVVITEDEISPRNPWGERFVEIRVFQFHDGVAWVVGNPSVAASVNVNYFARLFNHTLSGGLTQPIAWSSGSRAIPPGQQMHLHLFVQPAFRFWTHSTLELVTNGIQVPLRQVLNTL
jgi:hypothetical protein